MPIEELPSELLIHIFSYIHPKDLLRGWTNLNTRINSILHLTLISIEINTNDDFTTNLPSLEYFSSQIVYLKDQRPSPDDEINIGSFRNLRSLYLMNCSNKQSEDINPRNHPDLTRCYCPFVPWSFFERILFDYPRFLHLKSIGCPRGGSIFLLNSKPSPNPTIRHLHVKSASSETMIEFVQYLPRLVSLTIDLLYKDSSTSVRTSNHCSIRYLTIGYAYLSSTVLDQFLSSIEYTKLTELRLTFEMCHFEQLADILRRIPSLKRFQLRVRTIPCDFDLITVRLLIPWFLSLDYENILDEGEEKRILSLKTTNKQFD